MKILQINQVYKYGSTGRIVAELSDLIKTKDYKSFVAYGYPTTANTELEPEGVCCLQPGWFQRKRAILLTRLFDHHGFYNEAETRKLIRWMNEISPDIVHLHNIHSHYVNVRMLFDYIKQHDIPVVWTLHDCWSMTGHCAHFELAKCDKWKSECHDCELLQEYPPTWFFDKSRRNYRDKKQCFTGVKKLSVVSPSEWLAGIVRQSYLKEYDVRVINNGIDTSRFEPNACNYDDIKAKLGIQGKKMILALMSVWQKNKGIEYIKRLTDYLNENEVLVVVGLKPNQMSKLPKRNCIGISRTNSINELAAYYASADVFINPTLQDTFPTTNIEALSCGTPIVTFRTGGSVEAVLDDDVPYNENGIYRSRYGIIVPQCDFDALLSAIREVCSNGKEYYVNNCREKATLKYNKSIQYLKYIELYRSILNE